MDVQTGTRKLTPEVQIQEMIAEGGPLATPGEVPERTESLRASQRPAPPSGPLSRALESLAERIAPKFLDLLAENEAHVAAAIRAVPERSNKAARRTALLLELLEDQRDGRYEAASWRTLALASLAVAYLADPDDVVPRGLSFLRGVDDVAVAALVTRGLENDLREYCEAKGYEPDEYF